MIAALVVVALGGCGGDNSSRGPDRLFDGSPTRRPTVTLEGAKGPVVLTRARTVSVADALPGSAVASCAQQEIGDRRAGVAVVRTGVTGTSVTLVDPRRRYVFACDDSGGTRERSRRWCGSSAGQLHGGRLRDPRLDILCTTADGRPIGFVWIQPSARARYVVVAQPGYDEAYEPAAGLPIRVASTSGVSDRPLRVTIAISEHSSTGKLLRRYRVSVAPAG